jgi:tetratricopeptide (TPR) repeat protein
MNSTNMNDLEYIDDFFGGRLSAAEKQSFEQRIANDPVFAREVTFYLDALKASEEAMQSDRRALHKEWLASAPVVEMKSRRKVPMAAWLSVAAMMLVAIMLWFVFQPRDAKSLANRYNTEHFSSLPVTMGVNVDSLQQGVALYNERKFEEASAIFVKLHETDSTDWQVLQYEGLTQLQLKHYDESIQWFVLLQNQQGLARNPGAFLHALALLMRDSNGDQASANLLLHTVIDTHLQGEEDAKKILEAL